MRASARQNCPTRLASPAPSLALRCCDRKRPSSACALFVPLRSGANGGPARGEPDRRLRRLRKGGRERRQRSRPGSPRASQNAPTRYRLEWYSAWQSGNPVPESTTRPGSSESSLPRTRCLRLMSRVSAPGIRAKRVEESLIRHAASSSLVHVSRHLRGIVQGSQHLLPAPLD
jgi:hypothetical protein